MPEWWGLELPEGGDALQEQGWPRCPECHRLAVDTPDGLATCDTGPGCNVVLFEPRTGRVLTRVGRRPLWGWWRWRRGR